MESWKVVLQWLIVNTIIFLVLPYSFAQTNNKKVHDMSMESLFDKLIKTTDKEYLENEIQFRQGGSNVITVLKTKLNDKDSFTRIYANTMIKWIQGNSSNNDEALSYLDKLPGMFPGSILPPIPSPTGAAETLNLRYQSSVTNILAVHLIKLPNLQHWRVMAILFYLEIQKVPEITDILLRFISETSNEEYKEIALRTIDATKDPKLEFKILQEEARLKLFDMNLPDSIKSRL